MNDWTAEELAQRAFDLGLVDERQLRGVWAELGNRDVPAELLTQLLVRRELLTNYQLERLTRGERTGFFYGDYKIQYLVGAGTFARVFRAVRRGSGEVAGVKVLRSRFSEIPFQREQFLREADLGRELQHPNIVQIHEVAVEDQQPYMVMEFVEGRTLKEFLRSAPRIEPADALPLMIGMAAGLDFAYQQGISHRDLKPSNVLISAQKQAKLADFGLAAADPNLTEEALANFPNPRTVDYAGLERFSGSRKGDPRSDIYFMGCIFYHMLSGTAPLMESQDRLQRLNRARFLDVAPLEEVAPRAPRVLTSIVSRAMDLNPAERHATPSELLTELKAAAKALFEAQAAHTTPGQGGTCLMVVESNERLQDVLRAKLRQSGYRVIMTSDPDRPMAMFTSRPVAPPADCVVFSTRELLDSALEAFNVLSLHPDTRRVPAILLLGDKHKDWQSRAKVSGHRAVLTSPFTLQGLCATVSRVLKAQG